MKLPCFVLMACLTLPAQSRSFCSSDSDCNNRGTAAMKRGEIEKAIQLFERQAAFAEVAAINSQQRSRAVNAYNDLALAYMQKGDYLWARAWTHVALGVESGNSAAQSNLRKIDQSRGHVLWPASPAGEYVQYAGRGTWQSVVVSPSAPGKIEFCFSGLWWGANSTGPSGIGELKATVPLHGNRAEYASREFGFCRISLEFSADKLEATQTGGDFDCGFGHNVTLNGTFERISGKARCTGKQAGQQAPETTLRDADEYLLTHRNWHRRVRCTNIVPSTSIVSGFVFTLHGDMNRGSVSSGLCIPGQSNFAPLSR